MPAGLKTLKPCAETKSTICEWILGIVIPDGIFCPSAAFSLLQDPQHSICYACGLENAQALR
jgi:hypothetical protein